MDVNTTVFSGRMFLTGGLIALCFSVYSTLVFSIFNITEVIASSLVVLWGMCLLIRSKKMEDSYSDTDYDDQSGRISPFYYELDPVALRRELPPIPKDIGREYDPIVLDKV